MREIIAKFAFSFGMLPSAARRSLNTSIVLFLPFVLTLLPTLAQCAEPGYGTRWPDQHPDRVYIEQLNQSGLHDLAIEITSRRRGSSEVASNENLRAQWTMLWLESEVEKRVAEFANFVDTPGSLSSLLTDWKEQVRPELEGTRAPWIEYKLVWCRYRLARSGVVSFLAVPNRSKIREWSLEQLRKGLEELDSVQSRTTFLPTSGTGGPNRSGPTPSEVSSLVAEAKLLACDLLVLRANLYQGNSDERTACGSQMLTLLEEAEQRIGVGWEEYAKIDIAKAQAWLFLGQPDKVFDIANRYQKDAANRSSRGMTSLAAIGAEAARSSGAFEEASRWIEIGGGWESAPALAIEHFSIELARLASEDQTGLARVLSLKQEISSRFGPYWEQRADAVLVAMKRSGTEINSSSPPNSASIDLLRAEVKQFLAAKDWGKAIERLQQGELVAASHGDNTTALGMAMQGAALLGIQKEFASSADEFYRAAIAYSDSRDAPKSAMNAVGMIQEEIKVVGASSDRSLAEKAETLEQLVAQRAQIWQDIAIRWPSTEPGQVAAKSLSDYYVSNDRIWEACELWLGIWERLAQERREGKVDDKDTSIQEFASNQCLDTLRCIAWLKNQSWLDSRIIGEESQSRWEPLLQRIRPLSTSSVPLEETLREIESMERGYGWEYRFGERNEERNQPWYLLWVDAHLIASGLLQEGDKRAQLQSLHTISQDLQEKLPRQASEQSLMVEMAKRSLAYFRLQVEASSGDMEAASRQLTTLEGADSRDPWWVYHAARIYQGNSETLDQAERRYLRLANGLQSGSIGWLECRARSLQILRLQGKEEEAKKLAKLVRFLTGESPPHWKARFAE